MIGAKVQAYGWRGSIRANDGNGLVLFTRKRQRGGGVFYQYRRSSSDFTDMILVIALDIYFLALGGVK